MLENNQTSKEKRRISQVKAGAILSYLQMAISIVIGIVYTPIMIRLLGQSEYGLYNLVSSTISMLSMLSLGFGAGYIRYYAKYKKNNDQESIYKLNGLFLVIFSVIGLVSLLCGLFLILNIRMVFRTGLTDAEYETAKILMILMVANLSLSFPFSIFKTIVSAHEQFIFIKVLGMITTVLGPLVNLPLLLLGYGSIGLVIFSVSLALIVDAIYIFVVKNKLKQKFMFRNFEKGIFKSLFFYTAFIAINIVVDQINWSVDKFLLGRYQGTIAVAVYSVGYALYGYYMSFSTSISGVFGPRVHRIVNENIDDLSMQRKELTELFVKVGRIQYLILALIASGVVFFGQPFIYFWAGEGYETSYYVALLLILPSTISLTQNIGIEIQRAKNMHQFRSIVYLTMAVVNLIVSIFLCQLYGAIGASIGTALSLVLCNGFIMNIFYHKKCNINIISYWKNILRQSIGLIVPVTYGIILMLFISITSLWILIALIVSYVVIYVISMYFLGMNNYERNLVLSPFRKMLGRTNDKNS